MIQTLVGITAGHAQDCGKTLCEIYLHCESIATRTTGWNQKYVRIVLVVFKIHGAHYKQDQGAVDLA